MLIYLISIIGVTFLTKKILNRLNQLLKTIPIHQANISTESTIVVLKP